MNEEQQTTPSRLRTAYQQKAAAYLFSVDSLNTTSWIGDAARSLALRAVYRQPSDTDDGNGKESSSSWNELVCLSCGTLSYPHNVHNQVGDTSTVMLRPLKRGSTRRRRASRSRVAQISKESLQKQRMGNTNTNPQLRKEIIEQNQRMKLANLNRLGDGRSRHCVVNKCGFCGVERKRKGVEVKSAQKNKSSKREKQSFQKSIVADLKRNEKKDVFDNSNFISLPGPQKKSKANAMKSNTTLAASSKTSFSFKNKQADLSKPAPLLTGGKKKKTKKKQPGSKLMDFLSSLND
jgi:hypothetical protein